MTTRRPRFLKNERDAALSLPEASDAYKAAIEQYKQDVASARMAQWRNRCVSDGYEPGSTFKLITLASAIDSRSRHAERLVLLRRSGKSSPAVSRSLTAGNPPVTVRSRPRRRSAIPATSPLAISACAWAATFSMITSRPSASWKKTGVDLPGEASGLFYERKYLNNPAQYGTSYLITSSFGQSFRITPMQLVRSVAAIVNGGYVLEPYIVSEVLDADGNMVERNEKDCLAAGHQPADVRNNAQPYGTGRHRGHGLCGQNPRLPCRRQDRHVRKAGRIRRGRQSGQGQDRLLYRRRAH